MIVFVTSIGIFVNWFPIKTLLLFFTYEEKLFKSDPDSCFWVNSFLKLLGFVVDQPKAVPIFYESFTLTNLSSPTTQPHVPPDTDVNERTRRQCQTHAAGL